MCVVCVSVCDSGWAHYVRLYQINHRVPYTHSAERRPAVWAKYANYDNEEISGPFFIQLCKKLIFFLFFFSFSFFILNAVRVVCTVHSTAHYDIGVCSV